MNLTWNASSQPTLANLSYVVSMNDDYEVVETHVQPALEVVPSTHWYDVSAGAYVHRCIDLHGSLLNSTYLHMSVEASNIDGLQTQLVSVVDGVGLEQNVTDVPETFCLEGLDPLVFESSMGALTINNDTFQPQLPERRTLVAHVPEEGWLIQSEAGHSWEALLGEGGVLSMDADHCPINSSISTPARPQDGSDWIWDTKVRASGDIPLIESNQNLTLLMSEGANMSLCKDLFNPYPAISFPVVEGPELVVSWMGTTSRFWTTPWAIATNGTVLNTGMTSFTIHNPNNISVPFRLDRGGSFGEDWGHNWDGNALAPGPTSFELTPPSAPLATMWLSYEAGAVVLHLSSYQ
jgi:hypothetical protein